MSVQVFWGVGGTSLLTVKGESLGLCYKHSMCADGP